MIDIFFHLDIMRLRLWVVGMVGSRWDYGYNNGYTVGVILSPWGDTIPPIPPLPSFEAKEVEGGG